MTGVPPMTHAVPSHCPLRGDVVLAHDSTDSAMRNAPAKKHPILQFPAVFAGGDDGFDAEG